MKAYQCLVMSASNLANVNGVMSISNSIVCVAMANLKSAGGNG